VVLGSQLAARLGVRPGDPVSFFAFAAGGSADVSPREISLKVSGLFKTGYYDLDLNWAFAPIATAELIAGQDSVSPVLGLKVRRPARELEVERRVRSLLGPDAEVTGWRELNRLFFTALKTEKAMMMLLIGLVFVVVAVNIFHSLRRAVREREEEIATMRALGATGRAVRAVFVIEGLLIGAAGAFAGNLLGLLVSLNVNDVFAAAELLVNRVLLPLAQAVARPLLGGRAPGELVVFSPRVFYIDQVPARVLPAEVILGSTFAIACALVAALAASRRVAEVDPQEVLRRV
jgi:lipoprotein-releasing system permease protein